MAVPASLPIWVEVEPCPPPHLVAMFAAGASLREHIEAALADFNHPRIPESKELAAARLRGMLADADSAIFYAESMRPPGSNRTLHERIEALLRINETVLDQVASPVGMVAHWFPNPLPDQQLSGDILWFLAEILDVPVLIILIIRWTRIDRTEAKSLDNLSDAEMEALTRAHLRGPER